MPLEKYMIRLVKLMDRLVSLMEAEPGYCFVTDGQFIPVGDYLQRRPQMRQRVQKLMAEGRLKVGPWYTQPLETIVTGEAMIRNLYRGVTETEKLGPAMLFGYMIDQFGHASQTPQILRGFGITDAMSWRGIEDRARDVFEWAAPNGDIVYMHRSEHGYGEATALPAVMDDFQETADGHVFTRGGLRSRIARIKSLKDGFSQTHVQFWLNGIDHSWAQEDLFEVIDIINREFPEYDVRQSTPEDYAARAHEAYRREGVAMRRYDGELMHPDEQILVCAASSRADQKLRHYHAERLLEKRAEPMSAFAWLCGAEYPAWALNESWGYILENHAHDSLDCCSVDEVYERVMARYTSSISLSEQLTEDASAYLADMGGDGDVLTVFNTNSVTYEGVVTCTAEIPDALALENFDVIDMSTGGKADFAVLDTEPCSRVKYNALYGHPSRIPGRRVRLAIAAGRLAGFSMRRFLLVKTDKPRRGGGAPSAANTLENEFFAVSIRPNGCIDVLDKRSGARYGGLLQLADSGDCGNIWVHARPENNRIITNENTEARITKLRDDGLLTEYEIKYSLDIPEGYDFETKSRSAATRPLGVTVKLSLAKDTRYIGVEIELDNKSRFHQVRVLLPSGLKDARTSLSGQPFDVVERKLGVPEGFDFSLDPDCEYHPMQDFCAVTDGSRGLAVAAKGIFEYEAIDDAQRTLALTLLRSTKFEDADDRVGGYNMEKSYLLTKIRYELAVIPYTGGWRDIYQDVLGFVNPPCATFRRGPDEAVLPGYSKPAMTLPSGAEFIKVDGRDVYVTAVKREENGENLLVRLVSFAEDRQSAAVTVGGMIPCKTSWRYSFKEEKLERLAEGNTARLELMPGQIVTIGFGR